MQRMHTLLIVENDLLLSKQLMIALPSHKYHCFLAKSLEEAYDILEQKKIDIALLDRVLEDGDGIEIFNYLNEVSYHTRTILLSQLGDTSERIKGLSTGADDYLPKPFSIKELLLKIESLAFKEKIGKDPEFQIGDLKYNPATGLVSSAGRTAQLRRKENQIFGYLARRQQQIVTRDSIIDAVWGSRCNIPTHSTVDAYIRKIRVKLGSAARQLQTVRGFGYRLVGDRKLKSHPGADSSIGLS